MTDVEQLVHSFKTGELLQPTADQPNLLSLVGAIRGLLDAPIVTADAGVPMLSSLLGSSDHFIFILVDGLGLDMVEELPPSTFLRRQLAREIRTVFPSSTAPALTAIATGAWPAQHGVTGWWTHLPELKASGLLLPFVTRANGQMPSQPLSAAGITPEQAFPLPSWLGAANHRALLLLPENIVDTVYSTYFSGTCARLGYRTLEDGMGAIAERIRTASAPTYSYLYSPLLDEVGHRQGRHHEEMDGALLALNKALDNLGRSVQGKARLVITADHGLLDVPAAGRYKLSPTDTDLMTLLRYSPSGDARVMYFHVRDGSEETFRERFMNRFGDAFMLLATDDVERLRLLGPDPISSHTRARIGDFTAIARGAAVLEYTPTGQPGPVLKAVAAHSGLTPQEMRIPLIVA